MVELLAKGNEASALCFASGGLKEPIVMRGCTGQKLLCPALALLLMGVCLPPMCQRPIVMGDVH